jgi:hypothetical protein
MDRTAIMWTPATPYVPRPVRRRMYRLRDGLRCLSRPRIRACGFAIAPAPDGQVGSVGVVVDDEGKARYTGLIHCGSIWECPCCSMTVRAARAAEVTYAVESHGIKRCAMLTLTIRHDFAIGHDLKRVRQHLAANDARRTMGTLQRPRWAVAFNPGDRGDLRRAQRLAPAPPCLAAAEERDPRRGMGRGVKPLEPERSQRRSMAR